MSLGDWFYASGKDGTGGGAEGENSIVMSGLAVKIPQEGHFFYLSANGPRKQSFYLVGSPCSVQG